MTLDDKLEVTLSYFEPMSLEMIYIDLEDQYVQTHHELTMQDLEAALKRLVKSKKLKVSKKNDQRYWIRSYPKKSIIKRLIRLFKI